LFNKKSLFCGIIIGAVLATAFYASYTAFTLNPTISIKRSMSEQEKINRIFRVLDEHYVDTYDKSALKEDMYRGLIASLDDPYTTYMDADTLASFLETTSGQYAGIGVMVSHDTADKQMLITGIFDGSPAFKAGLQIGDKITEIDGVLVNESNYAETVDMIKGNPGTYVSVTVYRENRTITFEIMREKIDIPTVTHKMLENNIGYIYIASFDSVTAKQFAKSLSALTDENAKSLILDLRNNPGGILDIVCEIAGLLVETEYIVYTEDKYGERIYTYDTPGGIDIPLVVLVNGRSASASEVLAGAIRDTGAGVVVGETTFGKGLVQRPYYLPDNSGLKVTVAKYYTPSGICIDGIGITPDYVVEMEKEKSMLIPNISPDEDIQLQKAIELVLR